jgi:hypothetical protein
MTLHFDILQMETEGVRWVEAVPSMEHAQARVQELIAVTKSDYIIFDQRTADRTVVRSGGFGA